MLYVFQMDVGQMLTFEISLLMDTVSTLQQELARVTGISVDKQILLVSGGHSLKPQQKVISYGAGTDTNPVFLFSKAAIESQEAPLVKSYGVTKEVLGVLKDKMTEAINLPATFETVAKRTKVACEIRDSANKVLAFCSNEFKEQHLQYQGWGTVVANLEEIAQAVQKTYLQFKKAFTGFLPHREKYFKMLDNFHETINLLERIPLLRALKEEKREEAGSQRSQEDVGISFLASTSQGPSTLLEWITTQGQGQSIELLRLKCLEDLHMFDVDMLAQLEREVQEQLSKVNEDPHHMKELVGIERRLSELEKRLNEAKKISQEQTDMAQGFLNQQSRLSSTQSPTLILPDLCRSHQQQLKQMLDKQQRMETLQNNFKKSKQEMSTNIHQRLGWVMHIETHISKLDSDLIYHMKTLRILECNLELMSQIKVAPHVYADMVVETARRRLFSSKFKQWAEALVEDSRQLYISETQRRKQFARRLGEHFLRDTLFKGFEDMLPSFATKPPPHFDTSLPDITMDDIAMLKKAVPELEDVLTMSVDAGTFSLILLSKVMGESPSLAMVVGESSSLGMVIPSSSEGEWSGQFPVTSKPSIVVATEAPPTKFTLSELQEPSTAELPDRVSSLAKIASNVVSSDVRLSEQSRTKDVESASESSCSAVVSDAGPAAVQSVKTQTKTSSTHTDSTSPISSNEFATADFYFEDSMPSPMADSPLDKRDRRKVEEAKTSSEIITSLTVELAEKDALIQSLEQKLKNMDAPFSESGKLLSQKGSSTDGSTVVGINDFSDSAAVLESGGEASVMFCSSLQEVGKEAALCVDNLDYISESRTVTHEKPESLPYVTIVDDEGFRIQSLELELQTASAETVSLKRSLCEVELKMKDLVEQYEKTNCDKDNTIVNLQAQLTQLNEELSTLRLDLSNKHENLENLEKSLQEVQISKDKLVLEVDAHQESLLKTKRVLHQLKEKVRLDLSSLKRSLLEMKESVVAKRQNLNDFVAIIIKNIEVQVSLYNSTTLAEASAKYEQQKDELKAEMKKLELDLKRSQLDLADAADVLSQKNEEMKKQTLGHEEDLNMKCQEQKRVFEEALKDLETKHLLEMELEVDRIRADLKDSLEEVERLNRLKDVLNEELSEAKAMAERQTNELTRAHQEEVETLMSAHAKDKEVALALTDHKYLCELEQKERQTREQVAEIEARLESVQARLQSEKEDAVGLLTDKLIQQQEAADAELRQQKQDQQDYFSDLMLQKQLQHAEKLTELKTQFDQEREALAAEVSKLTNIAKSHMESQTENQPLADLLTDSVTQTELVQAADLLTHSETQTGMELLAEVISLTSSASYGSEEMIAHKQLSTLTDDRDSKDTDLVTKLQLTVDDLSVQLASAQEKIAMMDEELAVLRSANKELNVSCVGVPVSPTSPLNRTDSQQKDFMQTSNIATSFMVMDKEPAQSQENTEDTEAVKAKDRKIADLEKKLTELSMTPSERETTLDKVSIRGCDKGDLVLLCLDERHDQYVVFTVGTILHFLHSESHETLGLKSSVETTCRKSWILAEVVDKEYCLAKKATNRFRVPQGTCFYRVKCKPWKCEAEAGRQDRETSRQVRVTRQESTQGAGAKARKGEKKEGDSSKN